MFLFRFMDTGYYGTFILHIIYLLYLHIEHRKTSNFSQVVSQNYTINSNNITIIKIKHIGKSAN